MKINGEIGQEILLSGIIKKIMINEDGMIEYCVNVSGSDFSFWLHAPNIVFKTLDEVVDEDDFRKEYPTRMPDYMAEDDTELEEIPNKITVTREETETTGDKRRQTETNGDPSREYEETDEEWFTVEQPKKKRGRPRKATAEDLMKRAKE